MALKVAFIVPIWYEEGKEGMLMSPFLMPQINSLKSRVDDYKIVYLETGFIPTVIWKNNKEISSFKKSIELPDEWVLYSLYGSLHGFMTWLKLRHTFRLINSFGGSDILGSRNGGFVWFLRDFVTRQLSIRTAQGVQHVIVKNTKLYDTLKDKTNTRISIVPNGVNFEVFQERMDAEALRRKFDWVKDEFVILFNLRRNNSKLESVKNFDLAQKVYETVKKRLDVPVRLEIISNKTHEEINELFHAANCLLLTSFHEGSPNIVKEAMACNLPIVTVNCGDVHDRLRKVKNSYVSETYNEHELASYCEAIYHSGARSTGREALVKQGLDSESIAKKLVDIFNSVANG
ncbi:MAG: glycosyltransferase involved in cell wall biosynthesis [Algoriphagus sp.]|jgi:glycosyltransferase involved in cell wall biosynthesis